MKTGRKKRNSGDEPVGKLKVVDDFLPPPEELLPKEHTVKVTVNLDDATIRFFKNAAKQMGLKYQRMIREVLKGYAKKYG